MAIREALLLEFDHEMSNTRKILECVPDDKLAWKPHEKSFALGRLANHLSQIVTCSRRISHDETPSQA